MSIGLVTGWGSAALTPDGFTTSRLKRESAPNIITSDVTFIETPLCRPLYKAIYAREYSQGHFSCTRMTLGKLSIESPTGSNDCTQDSGGPGFSQTIRQVPRSSPSLSSQEY